MEIAFTQEGDERFTPEYMVSVCGKDAIYYICGPNEMMEDIDKKLKALGVKYVKYESWW